MKTAELTGKSLDWAVARREFPDANNEEIQYFIRPPYRNYQEFEDDYDDENDDREQKFWYHPSSDWAQGGPIIEREGIDINQVTSALWSARWWADNSDMAKNPAQRFRHNIRMDGPTPLVAAMRCYVASRLGDEVEVPKELMEDA